MSKLLIIDDDEELVASLVSWFEAQGFVVEYAHNGGDGLQLATQFGYDIIILDWQLPDIVGVDVLSRLRRNNVSSGVIFLTGRASMDDKTSGFDTGADDYLVKPVDIRELTARVKALMRRPRSLLKDVTEAANLNIDHGKRTVSFEGEEVALTKKELDVLQFFLSNPDRYFSAAQLLAGAWPSESEGSEEAVRTCIKKLRRKLTRSDGGCPLKTVKGSGYIFSTRSKHRSRSAGIEGGADDDAEI